MQLRQFIGNSSVQILTAVGSKLPYRTTGRSESRVV